MRLSRNAIHWFRIISFIAVMVVMTWLIRSHAAALTQTIHSMRPGWFVAGVAMYGFLFLPAALRWHLALRLNDSAVNVGITTRISLVGHFFYTLLFGAAGGDIAKSTLYARWYERPLPKVLAAASLDRALGCLGLFIFAGVAFVIASTRGGLESVGKLSLRGPALWGGAILAACITGAVLFFRKRSVESLPAKFLKAFTEAGQRLIQCRRSLFMGIAYAVAVQITLSASLALNLEAVSSNPIPWDKLAWTFPVISVVSALPVTVAGIGTRDSAAIVLFGLFGISPSEAIAASLLTASASMIWTGIGALLFWREALRHEADLQFKTLFTRVSH